MKKNQRVFIFLFVFFIAVAFGGIFGFAGRSSALDKTRDSIGAVTAVLNETITPTVSQEESALVDEFVNEQEQAQVIINEPEPEPEPEVQIIEVPQDQITLEENNEEPKEDAAKAESGEEAVIAEPVSSDDQPVRYFKFKVATRVNVLNVRESPSTDANARYKLKKGADGYVLKPGNTWCYVESRDGFRGYCSTSYLEFTELTEDDFPKKLIEEVEAPDEELSPDFNS